MKSLALLAPALSLLCPLSFAGDIKLTYSGTVTLASGPFPAPFQSVAVGDTLTMVVEVFDMPTGLPPAVTYPCDWTASSLQVGAAVSAFEPTASDCTLVQIDTPPLGSDGLLSDAQLPGLSGLAQAFWSDIQGTTLSGPLNQNFGVYPSSANVLGLISVTFVSPAGASISSDVDLLTIEASTGGPPQPVNYCTALPNSSGSPAIIQTTGTTSVAANDFGLRSGPAPVGEPAVFYYGPNQIQALFGDGNRCVGGGPGQVVRMFPFVVSDGTGFHTAALDNTLPAHAQVIAGAALNFQAWFRDPAAGMTGFNLSDGVSVTFAP